MRFKRFIFIILFSFSFFFVFAKEDDFYSIQSSSLTACHGDRWFLEEYDDYGKIILSVLYEKNVLVEKREYFYEGSYNTGLDISLSDKLIKIKYNEAGYEVEKLTYAKDGKTLKEKVINEYDSNNLLIKTYLTKDDTEYLSMFDYYKNKKKRTQTDFVNDEKVCFIEYKENIKVIHLFQFGKEIKVWEEEY